MGHITPSRKRLYNEMSECFAVIDSCLKSYYAGELHMYRPLAGQLRILLCDKSPLLTRIFSNVRIGAVRSIEWLEVDKSELFEGNDARLAVDHPPDQEFRSARMPFLITEFSSGLQIADLQFKTNGKLLPLREWVKQIVSIEPCELSIRQIIRSVADKGGGAHVDDKINIELQHMYSTGPAGIGVHVLFTVAIGRFAQNLGLYYAQFRDRFDYKGNLEDVVQSFDIDHEYVRKSAQVPEDLMRQERKQYVHMVLKRTR